MSDSSGSGVKATIVTTNKKDNKRVEKSFAIDVPNDEKSGSHLNSLRNCVNRLETQLNQYLTQIIDEENESGGSGGGVSYASTQPIASNSVQTPKDKKSSKNAFDADNDSDDSRRQSREPKYKKCKK